MNSEQQNESLNEAHVPLTEEAKKEHLEQYHSLIAEGEKSLLAKELEKSVDFFSDATRLIDVIFGTFAPGTFDAYLKYGSALVNWAHEQADLIRNAEENVDSIKLDVTGDESMNDQQLTEFDSIMKDAWDVLEVAKTTCERVLETKPTNDEDRKWQLNLSDAFYLLGKVMMLSGQLDKAKEEFLKAVEIKQKHSDLDDRVLVSVYFDLAKAFELNAEFADAKDHYKKVLEALNKKIGLLEADKENDKTVEEIKELKALSEEVKKSLVDLAEFEQTTADLKKLVEDTFKNSLPSSIVGDSIRDVSTLVRKRSLKSNEQPADSINENETKKSKVEE